MQFHSILSIVPNPNAGSGNETRTNADLALNLWHAELATANHMEGMLDPRAIEEPLERLKKGVLSGH